jgi:hypothetical protein
MTAARVASDRLTRALVRPRHTSFVAIGTRRRTSQRRHVVCPLPGAHRLPRRSRAETRDLGRVGWQGLQPQTRTTEDQTMSDWLRIASVRGVRGSRSQASPRRSRQRNHQQL